MLNTISTNVARSLLLKGIISAESFETYKYGVELFLTSTGISLTLLALSFCLGIFVEFIVFALSFWILRFFIGGYHCKSYGKCFMTMMIIFGLFALSLTCISSKSLHVISFFLICIALVIYSSINRNKKLLAALVAMILGIVSLLEFCNKHSLIYTLSYSVLVVILLKQKEKANEKSHF